MNIDAEKLCPQAKFAKKKITQKKKKQSSEIRSWKRGMIEFMLDTD